MTRHRPLMSTLAAALLLGTILPVGAALPDPPEIEQEEGYVITITQLNTQTELDYEEGEATHEVELKCVAQQPRRLDVVCLLEQLAVLEAVDDEGDNIYLPPQRRRGSGNEDYVAFAMGMTLVELKNAELSRPAYTVDHMVLTTQAVVALDRGEFELRAIVMDDEVETPFEIAIRLSEMKIGRDHKAQITIEYERETASGSPLLEAVYALDQDGNVLGGGRWADATDIFEDSGEFKAEFLVAEDADVTSFRLVFLTEYEVVPMTFELTEVFQH